MKHDLQYSRNRLLKLIFKPYYPFPIFFLSFYVAFDDLWSFMASNFRFLNLIMKLIVLLLASVTCWRHTEHNIVWLVSSTISFSPLLLHFMTLASLGCVSFWEVFSADILTAALYLHTVFLCLLVKVSKWNKQARNSRCTVLSNVSIRSVRILLFTCHCGWQIHPPQHELTPVWRVAGADSQPYSSNIIWKGYWQVKYGRTPL